MLKIILANRQLLEFFLGHLWITAARKITKFFSVCQVSMELILKKSEFSSEFSPLSGFRSWNISCRTHSKPLIKQPHSHKAWPSPPCVPAWHSAQSPNVPRRTLVPMCLTHYEEQVKLERPCLPSQNKQTNKHETIFKPEKSAPIIQCYRNRFWKCQLAKTNNYFQKIISW